MNKKCRLYKGVYLDPNSRGYQLLQEGKIKELDAHMKECARRAKELENPKGETVKYSTG